MDYFVPTNLADLPNVYQRAPTGNVKVRRDSTVRLAPRLTRSKSDLSVSFSTDPTGKDTTYTTVPANLATASGSRSTTNVVDAAPVPPPPPPLPPKLMQVSPYYPTVNTIIGRTASDTSPYDLSKSIAESAMDISLLTANANQLRLLITYNQGSRTYVACITFVILSLILQMLVAITMIVVSLTKTPRDDPKRQRLKIVTSIGVAIITMINILVASLVVAEPTLGVNAADTTSSTVAMLLSNVTNLDIGATV